LKFSRNFWIILTILVLALAGASIFYFKADDKFECRETPGIKEKVTLTETKRLEKELFSCNSPECIKAFLNNNKAFAELVLGRTEYPHDSILINELTKLVNDPYVDTLYQDVDSNFKDLTWLKTDLESAFENLKFYYPGIKLPGTIQTMVTGFSNDLLVTDSIVFVGLDFFIGPKAHYRPEGVSNYILRRYSREYIVPNIILHISSRYNKNDFLDKTLLAEMIFLGKSYYFVEKALPCTPDSIIMGYTAPETNVVNKAQERVWSFFIEKQLLYSTDHFVKNKYIGERPYTAEIGSKVPGRLGNWFGWQIVRKYAEKKNPSLEQLMGATNAQEILTVSGYKPKNK
jgi:hypothetical protein